jgi:hypothetical protein
MRLLAWAVWQSVALLFALLIWANLFGEYGRHPDPAASGFVLIVALIVPLVAGTIVPWGRRERPMRSFVEETEAAHGARNKCCASGPSMASEPPITKAAPILCQHPLVPERVRFRSSVRQPRSSRDTLSLVVVRATPSLGRRRTTKDFIIEQARMMAPDVREKSGVWYRLNRLREEQITSGKKLRQRLARDVLDDRSKRYVTGVAVLVLQSRGGTPDPALRRSAARISAFVTPG